MMREIRKPEMTKKTSTPAKPPGKKRAIGVESDHPEHRERAQSIDVLAEIEVAPAPCGGEVGRVEGLVQQGFRELFAKGVTGKARRADPQGALAGAGPRGG